MSNAPQPPTQRPHKRLAPFVVYLAFVERVPFGNTTIGWEPGMRGWKLHWSGRIDGLWYHMVEMIPEWQLESFTDDPEELGQRVAERWHREIQQVADEKGKV
jgi:hypothetical protein